MTLAHHRHAPFYWALLGGCLSLPLGLVFPRALVIEIAAIVFFVVYLALIAIRLPTLTGAYLKRHAAADDTPMAIIFAVTLAAVIISVVSLFSALNARQTVSGLEIALSFASVALGWFTIHTMAAMHYAHVYWSRRKDDGTDHARGLDFPETPEPGAFDFLYFGLVIGMTAQTSDIAITTTAMRKINLLHAVIAFFFNTVLVAAAVNTAVSLAQ